MTLAITTDDFRLTRLNASGRALPVAQVSKPVHPPQSYTVWFQLPGNGKAACPQPTSGKCYGGRAVSPISKSAGGPNANALETSIARSTTRNCRAPIHTFQRFNVLTFQRPHAFTLAELLVVIAIIGILAAMILVVLSQAAIHARKTTARMDVTQIANAIDEYDSLYGHMPVSTGVQQSGTNYITFGGTYTSAAAAENQFPTPSAPGWGPSTLGYSTPVGLYVTSNSDVMAILLDLTNYPNTTTPTVNVGHQKNPMQKILLSSAKFAGDTTSPGVGTDLNYRDPWGNPYIISLNLNGDNKCEDPYYALPWISSSTGIRGGSGLNGLSYQSSDTFYLFHGNVMVWSMGPDGPYNHSPSSFTYPPTPTLMSDGQPGPWARDPSNKNHILSWAP